MRCQRISKRSTRGPNSRRSLGRARRRADHPAAEVPEPSGSAPSNRCLCALANAPAAHGNLTDVSQPWSRPVPGASPWRRAANGARRLTTRGVVRPLWFESSPDGGKDPIGEKLDMGDPVTIVGIVSDARRRSLDTAPQPALYLPYTQFVLPYMGAVVRTDRGAGAVASAVKAAVAQIDPDLPVGDVKTMEQIVDESTGEPRRLRAFR